MIEICAVNVGTPSVLSTVEGENVWSGITKRAVAPTARLWLSELNLSGDSQADLSVHGGVDKAVYVYPSEHLTAWRAELREELGPAPFGENISSRRVLEDDTCIGDVWQWGDALIQVAQPRWPCFKLALYRQRADIQARFRASGRTGWYLRVLQPGEVPAAGPIDVIARDPAGITVTDAHAAMSDVHLHDLERARSVAGHPALAEQWRTAILERVDRARARAATKRPPGASLAPE